MAISDKNERREVLSLYGVCAAACFALMPVILFAQAVQRPELSIELIDPKTLRVCADPNNMPFSTDKGEGFENKLAELFAAQLGKDLSYTWYPQAPGFVRNTLRAYKCDVVMGIPQGDDVVQVTNPYYRTAYAFVVKRAAAWTAIDTLRRCAAKGQTHWHRGWNPPGEQHGGQRPDGQCEALSARRRYPRQFLRRSDDARSRGR